MTLSALGIFSAAGAGGGGAFSSDYELISSTILTTTQGSISFDVSTLASTYRHLQLRVVPKTNENVVISGLRMRLGSPSVDSGTNYAAHQLFGNNNAVSQTGNPNETWMFAGTSAGANAASNAFHASVIDILDAFSSTKFKTMKALYGHPESTAANSVVGLNSGLWRNTATIQTIEMLSTGGASFVSGSRFSLYGIRG
jgi:hypothetical protein